MLDDFRSVDRFTIKSQQALAAAARLAQQRANPQVVPVHLLSALLDGDRAAAAGSSGGDTAASAAGGVVLGVLTKLSVELPALRAEIARALDELPRMSAGTSPPATVPSSELTAVIQAAEGEAQALSDQYVSTEHLLLALSSETTPPARAGAALRAVGATRERLLQALAEIRGSHRVTDQNPEEKLEALERFGQDLTQAAEQGKLDPVIGRDEEIRRVIQVLSRRTKNNPVLIGEPGVGKTAIVEGLAQRIVSATCPTRYANGA